MTKMLKLKDDALHQQLKAAAAAQKRTVEDLVADALRSYLKQPAPSSSTPAAAAVRAVLRSMAAPAPTPHPQFERETYGPPINDYVDVCRRCKHAYDLHRPHKKHPDQLVCQLAGCNCARLMK